VEDAEDAECGAEMLRRARDLQERRRTRLQQQVVDDPFVLEREGRQRVWQGEDDMGVPDRQQLALALVEPLVARVRQALWSMPIATRVERDGTMATRGTAIEMSTQGGGPAVRNSAGARGDAARYVELRERHRRVVNDCRGLREGLRQGSRQG